MSIRWPSLLLRRVPKDLPVFGLVAFGGALLAYSLAGMLAGSLVGAPSVPWILRLFSVVFVTGIAAVFGLAVGSLMWAVWRMERERRWARPRETWWLIIVVVAALGLATQAGTMMALYAGARAKPAVLSGAGLFERSSGPPPGKVLRTGTLAYAFVQGADPFFWEGRKVEFSYSRGGVVISMPSASKRLTVSTRGLSFVEFAYAAPIRVARGAEDLLAMVLECRSIGNRAVILVLDSDLKILYQERVRTCWRIDRDPLEIWSPDDSGRESIVVGPSCAKPIVLRARQ